MARFEDAWREFKQKTSPVSDKDGLEVPRVSNSPFLMSSLVSESGPGGDLMEWTRPGFR